MFHILGRLPFPILVANLDVNRSQKSYNNIIIINFKEIKFRHYGYST